MSNKIITVRAEAVESQPIIDEVENAAIRGMFEVLFAKSKVVVGGHYFSGEKDRQARAQAIVEAYRLLDDELSEYYQLSVEEE